ncbi:T9SS type A sorting domain-containing protein [Hymenobacter artigasi]|uniref:Delta-60 repeat protein n=1 Tax=Hymenobacter artigasi TaxID=2719616 RepID=A0ABX1HJ11_9BACT|nr:T9SS type A sorting domain-containing protein [Hymenobacter artigasi]NKI90268.1 putative delta-60 repeat protein [Hymenobacter artigasi]
MKHVFTRLFLLVGLLCGAGLASLQAQILDPTFQPTVLKNGYLGGLQTGVQRLAVQPDGKVITAGGFDFVNGVLASKIQRLNANGTSDATFNPGGIGANGFIGAVALQADGRILIAGGFTTYNGTPALALARLNANGTLDPTFASLTPGVLRQIGSLAIQPDGKILVGSTNSFAPGQAGALVRLNTDGTPDASFSIGTGTTSGIVNTIVVQTDGKIVVGGSFTAFSGQAGGLVRLNANGSLDTTFGLGAGFTGTVNAAVQQPDGKLLVGGSFTQVNGQASPAVVRLLPTGALDASFAPGTGPTNATGVNASVQSLVLLPNGNVLIGGTFVQFNGVARGRVARLLPGGTLDASYAAGTGANNTVVTLAPLPNGQVLAVGLLTQYDGVNKTGAALLTTAGTIDATFAPVFERRGTISNVAPLTNGQLLIIGSFTEFNGIPSSSLSSVVRLNADGTVDQSYSTSNGSLAGALPDGSFYNILGLGSTNTLTHTLPSGANDNAFTPVSFGLTTSAGPGLVGIKTQPDGRVLAYGTFTTFGGAARNGIARLNANGTLDNTFVPPTSSLTRTVNSAFIQASGKIVLTYSETGTGSTPGYTLVRLNADGSLDNTFAIGAGAGPGNFPSLLQQPDGKLLVSNVSTFNGQTVPFNTVRLLVDGAIDPTFNGLTTSYSPNLVLPDGRILATTIGQYGAAMLVRLNGNGSLDNAFAPVSTPAPIFTGDDSTPNYTLQPDGKIIAYGNFRSIAGQARIGLARLTNPVATATRAGTAALPLAVYPNPASQRVTVVLPAVAPATQATLLDLTGRAVRRWALPTQQAEATFDLNAIAAGVYVLRIPGTAGTYQQKVVVTR